MLVPLKHVSITGTLEAGHALVCAKFCYANLGDQNPIECTFELPLDSTTVVSKLIATIDDRVVEAKIKEKQKAKD